jgi:hypothetical protein
MRRPPSLRCGATGAPSRVLVRFRMASARLRRVCGPSGLRSLAQDTAHPSPGSVGPASRDRSRRYADAPAAALLTGLRGWRTASQTCAPAFAATRAPPCASCSLLIARSSTACGDCVPSPCGLQSAVWGVSNLHNQSLSRRCLDARHAHSNHNIPSGPQ